MKKALALIATAFSLFVFANLTVVHASSDPGHDPVCDNGGSHTPFPGGDPGNSGNNGNGYGKDCPPVDTPVPTPTKTPKPTETPKPTCTPKPTSTPTPTATPSPSSSPTPNPTATPEPTSTPVLPTPTPSPSSSPVPTATPTPPSNPPTPPVVPVVPQTGALDGVEWLVVFGSALAAVGLLFVVFSVIAIAAGAVSGRRK